VELDISLCFVPPMDEQARGIVVTRTLELPFAPTNGTFITGIALNGQPMAEGFKLEDVTWDLDHQRFLATTSLISQDFPIAEIPVMIRDWIDRGWKLGSYENTYDEELEYEQDLLLAEPIVGAEDEEHEKRWPTMNLRSRPPALNRFLAALAREMARCYNNWDIAYAIDKTKTYFTEEHLRENKSRAAAKFRDAQAEFDRMTFEQQYDWREKVLRKRACRKRTAVKKA
jgi:hypothetical protein